MVKNIAWLQMTIMQVKVKFMVLQLSKFVEFFCAKKLAHVKIIETRLKRNGRMFR